MVTRNDHSRRPIYMSLNANVFDHDHDMKYVMSHDKAAFANCSGNLGIRCFGVSCVTSSRIDLFKPYGGR